MSGSGGKPGRGPERAGGYVFVAPVLVLTLVFSVVPLLYVLRRSLYVGNVFDLDLRFAGLDNYREVLTGDGGPALLNTAVYTVGFVLVSMLLGMGVALLLDVRLPGLAQVRAFFIIPVVVPAVATALIWFTLFQPNSGLFNRVLGGVGLPQVSLDDQHTAMLAVIAFGAWQFFGEVVILYLAALKGLPGDVLEAAEVDGAGAWQRLRYIRLPLLRQQTALIAVVATLTGLQAFTQIKVLTNGGPQGATRTALYYVYEQGFNLGAGGSSGRADAMAMILFVVSLVVTLVQLAIIGRAAR
ncbi:sugar ABC transporter permease [Nocardioides mangrovicus]|uniref:Sugar ABC transporter permease n=1 Tax=Nocardioides mangrovicus TaxID=2478913 RepID=A0A3L8NZC7_9ACTN|nr:sugar ABC transporter permease [Nocardioides mangrovicus]RLV48525.1 sugar ABC transporter permease [Nocardioides mangrovicus]